MPAFHPLTVATVERIAEDAVCLTLAIPQALREQFKFAAGQYVPIRRSIGGREEQRTYSIVTAPGGALLRLGVREQSNGRVSRDLAQALRPGDLLDVGRPLGRFRTNLDPARSRSYVAFAAGSGITPVLSLAADILGHEPRSRFTLIYGNRSIARTMFIEDILALKNRHLDRFAAHFIMSREPQQAAFLNGRLDGAKVHELAGRIADLATADEYFICGPGTMVDEVRSTLQRLNESAVIRVERFAAAGSARADPAARERAPVAQEILATITIVMDGRRRSFPMSRQDASVLEAAERAGLALPFSCRSGICATCRARILQGTAEMTHNIALAPWEVDAGFLLCCQARPGSATLELSYDEK
ncbi:MAG TPA: 2Fe-2S iron-sulfur cluster-binding protein [Steroidobacteraceae bacterium]|nr:2Fe-2S iron-sulfur cluster-binding protein [Steroidobacteraceae bacterium]